MRFVNPLPEGSQETLTEMHKYHPKSRVRTRAQMVLLSAEGYKRNEIAKICKTKHDTVSSCLTRWENEGLTGLFDKPRGGRPRILTAEEENLALELIQEDPRNSKKAQSRLHQQTGKKISPWTFKRTLKRSGLTWKRMRSSVKQSQDPEKVDEGKKNCRATNERKSR